MARIDVLAEQTKFLLEKQKEVLAFFDTEINSLYAALESGKSDSSFQDAMSSLSQLKERSVGQMEKDVRFLEEQLSAIENVQKIADPEKKEELVSLMLEGGQDLDETEKFNADVEQDTKEAKEGFSEMAEDIRAVYQEEGMKELALLLQAHLSESEECDKCEECHESEEGSCDSDCNECKGSDIFSKVSQDE